MAKRIFDLSLAIVLFVILSPVIIVIAIVVYISMGAPVIFKQLRPGLYGKPFEIFKFRTMTDDRDEKGNLLSDGKRLTPVGRFLRKTSLDELPQLLNVIKGDLSFVGPRPLLMEYLPRYTPEQARRHEVKPGITGWAQIKGRNAITWEERFKLDVWYVDNRSFWLDIKIIFCTIVEVFKKRGINAPGYDTMPEFMGSENKTGV
ncbi:MAG: sugar transferase [Syntrophorhabdaceae bacterium]|nr:sugar transferase [Syntrophorhabdaceae bacterium]